MTEVRAHRIHAPWPAIEAYLTMVGPRFVSRFAPHWNPTFSLPVVSPVEAVLRTSWPSLSLQQTIFLSKSWGLFSADLGLDAVPL